MEACQDNNLNSNLEIVITTSDDLTEIIDWLNPRMKEWEKTALLNVIGCRDLNEVRERWVNPEIKEAFRLEIRKRATAADCKFKLETSPSSYTPKNNKFIPRTFIDMSSQED